MAKSLWGAAFDIPDKKKTDKEVLKKVAEKKPSTKTTTTVEKQLKSKSTKMTVAEKLKIVEAEVHRILGVYEHNTQCIRDKDTLHHFINRCIENNVVAIDTETNNSLDPITCKIMGACLYTPGEKNIYIPMNHVDSNGNRLENQITEEELKEELDRLQNTFTIFHNGKFDYAVIKCTCNCEVHIDWDTLIGAKLLDENELSAGLKQQYISKIDPSIEKYDIEGLFDGLEYAIVDPDLFALYAATDAFMTYKLYLWQKKMFERAENTKLYNLFKTLEMPLVKVIAELEMSGMSVDQEYGSRLSEKYHKKLDALEEKINAELKNIEPVINQWRQTPDANYHPMNKAGTGVGKSKSEQLTSPVNLGSPTQLAILFYDVYRCPTVSKKSPRGTGEEELIAINEKLKLPICDLIIQRRALLKLLTTYIDVIPELAKGWPDGRVRTHFNQYGAATGRLSSSTPLNFQNIPSHEKSIRLLFCAQPGYRILGGDFSAQEPRLTAFYSQDENMIKAYNEGRDLYAVIASRSFGKPYEDCLEFYPEGTKIMYEGKEVICGKKTHTNKEGKERRSQAKSILLGRPIGFIDLAVKQNAPLHREMYRKRK